MDLEDLVQQQIQIEEFNRRDKGDFHTWEVDSDDVDSILNNMTNAEFLSYLSTAIETKLKEQ